MKTIRLFTLSFLVLFLSNLYSFGSLQERTKSFDVNKGDNLVVNVDPGNIIINVWSKSEVFIKAKGIDDDEVENLKMTQSGSTVKVVFESDLGWSDNTEFEISVPAEFNLDLVTTGGNVDVTGNLTGAVEVSTQGGNVGFADIDGNLKVHTSGGNIITGDLKGEAKLTTMGGNVSVGKVSGGNTTISSMGGNIIVKDG